MCFQFLWTSFILFLFFFFPLSSAILSHQVHSHGEIFHFPAVVLFEFWKQAFWDLENVVSSMGYQGRIINPHI